MLALENEEKMLLEELLMAHLSELSNARDRVRISDLAEEIYWSKMALLDKLCTHKSLHVSEYARSGLT